MLIFRLSGISTGPRLRCTCPEASPDPAAGSAARHLPPKSGPVSSHGKKPRAKISPAGWGSSRLRRQNRCAGHGQPARGGGEERAWHSLPRPAGDGSPAPSGHGRASPPAADHREPRAVSSCSAREPNPPSPSMRARQALRHHLWDLSGRRLKAGGAYGARPARRARTHT
jgi:hypothetical protein